MVEVWGGMLSGFEPSTLCRPPEIGSSRDAVKDSAMSQIGVEPGSCRDRSIRKAPLR